MEHVLEARGKLLESVSGACEYCVGSARESVLEVGGEWVGSVWKVCGKYVGSVWEICGKCVGSVGGSCFGSAWECGIEREHL